MGDYIANAKNRGLSFKIDLIHFKEIIQKECFYCGAAPENVHRTYSGHKFFYQGLDRIVNSEGYTLENVVPCCEKCNAMKSDILTAREMLVAVKAIKKLRK